MKGYRTFILAGIGMVCMTAIAIVCLLKGLLVEAQSAMGAVVVFGGVGTARTLRREP